MPLVFLRRPLHASYSETVVFSTEVSRAENGSEENRLTTRFNTTEPVHKIAMIPFSYDLAEGARIFNELVYASRNAEGGLWVPLWHSETPLDVAAAGAAVTLALDTTIGEFVNGGFIVIIDINDPSHVQFFTINSVTGPTALSMLSAVTTTFPIGSSVLPVVFCTPDLPESLTYNELARQDGGVIQFTEVA